tara:strand:- start:728 stop:1042 length:315 start_codon:yes stop_codon:yes gene_type:complete
MKIIKTLFIFSIFTIFLNNCSSLGEAKRIMSNDKVAGTDEFLIKKKAPLAKPPGFDTIPEPGSIENQKTKNNIEAVFNASISQANKSKSSSSSAEKSILNKIKK